MKRMRQMNGELDAKSIPSELEIAWAAGIYEGEGSCSPTSGGVNASVVQKDPELLYRLRDLFGGSVTVARAEASFGQTLLRWRCCGDRARLFLVSVYHWLTARRKVQIDRTDAFRFVRDRSTVSMLSYQQLQEELGNFLESHRKTVREKKRECTRMSQQKTKADPVRAQELREYQAKWHREQRKQIRNAKEAQVSE